MQYISAASASISLEISFFRMYATVIIMGRYDEVLVKDRRMLESVECRFG